MSGAVPINTLRYNPDACGGCGVCVEVCPHAVFAMDGGKAIAAAERCIECGACSLNCPTGAITVESGVGCAYALMKAALFGGGESRRGSGDCCAATKSDSCC